MPSLRMSDIIGSVEEVLVAAATLEVRVDRHLARVMAGQRRT
jgi:hypothetical protein